MCNIREMKLKPQDNTPYSLGWLKLKEWKKKERKKNLSVCKDVKTAWQFFKTAHRSPHAPRFHPRSISRRTVSRDSNSHLYTRAHWHSTAVANRQKGPKRPQQMEKQDVVCTHNGSSFNHRKGWSCISIWSCSRTDESGKHYDTWNNSHMKRYSFRSPLAFPSNVL